MAVEIREARTAAEVAAAGRVTVAANAEFAPTDPGDPAVDFPEAGQADKAFDLLRQTLRDLQGDDEEVPLSGLKDQIRKRDPGWSEKDLGYAGFLQFVKAAAAKGIVNMEWDDNEGDYFLYVPD